MSLSLLPQYMPLSMGFKQLSVGILFSPGCNFISVMFLKAWSIQNFGYDLRKPKSKSWLTIASLPFKELLPPTFQARVPHLRTIMANSSSNGNGSLYGLSQYVDLILRWPFCLHIHWNPQICSQSFESFFIVPLRWLKVVTLSFSDIFLIK